MNRRYIFGTLAALTLLAYSGTIVDSAADWIDAHREPLFIAFAVAVLAFIIFGAFVIDALNDRTARREVTRPPAPAPSLDRHLPSGSPIHSSRSLAETGKRAARTRRPERAMGRAHPSLRGHGGNWR